VGNIFFQRRFSFVFVLSVFTATIFYFTASNTRASEKILTEADYRSLAIWSTVKMNITVDLTGDVPNYIGTIWLTTDSPSPTGPVLILNLSDASMRLTDLRITDGNVPVPTYTVDLNESAPDGTVDSLSLVKFAGAAPGLNKIEVSYEFEFVKEQGQVLHKPELEYASWVTGWYPTPIANSVGLADVDSLSSPGQITFLMPNGLNAISNGKLVDDKPLGEFKSQTWASEQALAWSYAVAPYTVSTVAVRDVDVSIYMLNEDTEPVQKQASMIANLIDLLEQRFGEYPFRTFGLAEIPDSTTDYFGASSEQGFIVAESKNFTNNYGLTLFSHEVAHAWWGNKFSCSGEGASLCTEAMAQIGTLLGTELIAGKQAMRDVMEVSEADYAIYQSARGFFAMWRSGEALPLSKVEGWHVHRLMDSKGMWFWQMLREKIGDELFFSILRRLTTGELVRPTLVELARYFGELSGQDLSVFFDQWLNRHDAPVINMSWHGVNPVRKNKWKDDDLHETMLFSLDEGQKKVSITLTQEQEDVYELELDILFEFFRKPPIRETIDFSERQKTFVFDLDGMIKNVRLDPDRKVLIWRPAYGPKPELN